MDRIKHTPTTTSTNITLCYINARSIKNKAVYLCDYITTHHYDLFVISETWLNCPATNDSYINALLPPGYSIHHADRDTQRGGGVAIVYKQSLQLRCCRTDSYEQFEHLKCSLNLNNSNIEFIVFYRPPPSPTNTLSTSSFLTEWEEFLSHTVVSTSELVIIGDANLHLENLSLHTTQRFIHSLEACGLKQHIYEPTHYHGHTLDTLISRETSTMLNDIEVRDIGLCNDDGLVIQDHLAIQATLMYTAPTTHQRLVSYRKLQSIDIETLRTDIKTSPLSVTTGTLEELTDRYTDSLSALLDKHAPVVKRYILPRPRTPWYTELLRDAKRLRRKLERKYRKTKKASDKQKYRDQCSIVGRELYNAKLQYYSRKVEETKGDTKSLFKITENLLASQQHHMPSSTNDETLSNEFAMYFEQKIIDIRKQFNSTLDNTNKPQSSVIFTQFTPASTDEIRNIIMTSPNKTCGLDPAPTWLVKKCIHELLPIITQIINCSMAAGCFPHQFKTALIKPIIKKPHLDVETLKNYRPVSTLHFISKVLEKTVSKRLEEHLQDQQLHDEYQSAYRSCHSTETAVLKLHNDIVSSLDQGRCTVLVSLDLSAAFDTVDHNILINRLECIGIQHIALQWFKSYVRNRTYQVAINDTHSTSHDLTCGVPQGSVLGARLYTIYTQPMTHIFRKHNVRYHCYADDTQVYIHCDNNVPAINTAIRLLEDCIRDVIIWMCTSTLKINEEKTEFIIFTAKQPFRNDMSITIGPHIIQNIEHIKVLGIMLDTSLTLDNQINAVSKACYLQIRRINTIRRYLTQDAVRTLIQATVTVRLDYCNCIYINIPLKSLRRLQLSQNSAARVISRTPRRDHITPVLRHLHWLPINKRCQFKIYVLAFKALHHTAPNYISDLLNWYHPNRPLRSANTTSLVPNRNRTVKYGRRLLDTSTATLWNTLPESIKTCQNLDSFKICIKTFLFNQ